MAVDVQEAVPVKIGDILREAQQLATVERLTLAKLLLESVLADEQKADADWRAMGLEAFQQDWDNDEDAIYDNWREHYGVPAR